VRKARVEQIVEGIAEPNAVVKVAKDMNNIII
jgi:hypothetical protein